VRGGKGFRYHPGTKAVPQQYHSGTTGACGTTAVPRQLGGRRGRRDALPSSVKVFLLIFLSFFRGFFTCWRPDAAPRVETHFSPPFLCQMPLINDPRKPSVERSTMAVPRRYHGRYHGGTTGSCPLPPPQYVLPIQTRDRPPPSTAAAGLFRSSLKCPNSLVRTGNAFCSFCHFRRLSIALFVSELSIFFIAGDPSRLPICVTVRVSTCPCVVRRAPMQGATASKLPNCVLILGANTSNGTRGTQ
jgi:hypothetical protein